MWYLFFQMWLWILIAFVLGWLANWFFCCRRTEEVAESSPTYLEKETPEPVVPVAAAAPVAAKPAESNDGGKPVGFASAPADADDLKRIKGIGVVNEKALNGIGIYTFSQIADWTADNISWVENFLAFPGRIGREDWVGQSKTLAQGGDTNFSKKVDSGDVDYSSQPDKD